MNTKNKKGFSLIEILIVITIIGILMAIIVPTYKGIASRGRAVKCQANLKNLYTATMLYAKSSSHFPHAFSCVWEGDDGTLNYRKGWIHWSTDKSWEEVYNNLSLGVTHWKGDEGYFSVTNGTIWSNTGKSIESYSCPEFKVKLDRTTSVDPDEIKRSYVYNRYLDGRNAFRVKRMSSTLMFGEGAVDVLMASGGDQTGEGGENENQWDGCFMPGEWVESYEGAGDWHFEPGRNNETLGHYHKDETSFIVFCDGHIEKLRKTSDRDVLFDLCEGEILKRADF
jgi:prepilin-type N-terminal cleavage/methylation domain-containing protein